jgi:hypothetical protein
MTGRKAENSAEKRMPRVRADAGGGREGHQNQRLNGSTRVVGDDGSSRGTYRRRRGARRKERQDMTEGF